MALIVPDKISRADKTKVTIHNGVTGTYTVFKGPDGHTYFQLDTYGGEDRQIQHKISQSIQFDETTARFLVGLISNSMGLGISVE